MASEYWAKFDTIKDAMWLGRTDGALVRVIVPMGKGEGAEEFARAAGLGFFAKAAGDPAGLCAGLRLFPGQARFS